MVRGRTKNERGNGPHFPVKVSRLPVTPENGAERPAQPNAQFRRRGPRAAANRALRLMDGQGALPPWRAALLASTARLLCHLENVSNSLFAQGEFRQDGEPKLALAKLMELDKQVSESLRYLFGDDGADPADPLSALLRNDSGYVGGAKR